MSSDAFMWRDRIQLSIEPDRPNTRRKAHQVGELIRRIKQLHREGLRPTQVADKIGITRRYCQQLRKKAGLPPYAFGKPKRDPA